MSKNVYISTDKYGRKYVREIIPDGLDPISEWYNDDFSAHCIKAPDNVESNMFYNEETGTFYFIDSAKMIDSDPLKFLIESIIE